MSAAPYADLVAQHGLAASHRLALELVAAYAPAGARVLDVGCATGYLTAELGGRGYTAVGVEPDPLAASEARAQCAEVVVGDVEDAGCRAELEALAPFGAIVCGDVLEHLRDPWDALRFLAALLTPDGVVVASVPNVGHWTARRALLCGRFPYADHGLFDRTHLRFFTRTSARELAARAGLAVADERFAPAPLPLQARLPWLRRFEALAARRAPEAFALQVVLALRPANRPGDEPPSPPRAPAAANGSSADRSGG